ncbi:hypothetical protein BS17DRAFT_823356 [Gyrodon lividus]|nr:hypothetical protein BS17DRAFT_823356 [Gyrodon lividus]
MQFKLTFILIGAVLAAVNAAPTVDAPAANIPSTDEEAYSAEPHFYYNEARAETTAEEAYSAEPHFYYDAVSQLSTLPPTVLLTHTRSAC